MKKAIIIILAMLAATTLQAQNIIIGETVPKVHISQWLMDFRPEPAEYTCIVFYHSESQLCRDALPIIKRVVKNLNGSMSAVIVTKEAYDAAGVTLTEHLDDHIGVAFDDDSRTFRYFQVTYIPFCVIYDQKHRAVWCGNAASMDEGYLQQLFDASKVKYRHKDKPKKKDNNK